MADKSEIYAPYIIETMLDYYVNYYIEKGRNLINALHQLEEKQYFIQKSPLISNIKYEMFDEIRKKADLIKEKVLDFKIDKTSVFYFFNLLESSKPKEAKFKKHYITANNVYFERNSLYNLDLKNYKRGCKPEKLIEYIKKFIDSPNAYPLINYIGTMHLMEILIRSIFFFVMNPKMSAYEKEMLLNIFTWMIINSYQNLFITNKRHWKIAYYFRNMLKYLFFDREKKIKSYDKNKDNIKNNIKSTYYNTTNKIKSILSKDITEAKPLFVFSNNISNTKISSINNKPYLFAPPFFISVGKEFEKHTLKLILYVAISTCNYSNNRFINNNIILSYTHLTK